MAVAHHTAYFIFAVSVTALVDAQQVRMWAPWSGTGVASNWFLSSPNFVNHSVELWACCPLGLIKKENIGPYFLKSTDRIVNPASSSRMYLVISAVLMLCWEDSSLRWWKCRKMEVELSPENTASLPTKAAHVSNMSKTVYPAPCSLRSSPSRCPVMFARNVSFIIHKSLQNFSAAQPTHCWMEGQICALSSSLHQGLKTAGASGQIASLVS